MRSLYPRRLMAFGCHTAVAASALTLGAAALAAPDTPLTVPADYRMVWSDEFDTDGLPDPAKWAYDTDMNQAGWHNAELQYYAGPRKENAVVRKGRLVLRARKESLSSAPDWGGQRYTSARLITRGRADWTYGFFEVRAKLPCGKGTWPAIWMLNSAGDWPAGGELDIMEHVGKEPGRVFSTVHTAAGHGGSGSGNAVRLRDACKAFHNYQMHWTADVVRFGVDGLVHFEYRNARTGPAQWPFDRPQFLILNIAVGGHLGGEVDDRVFPATMEVEHVRVWQRRP
jgi:beta-glucanase (GH16 family)